MAVTQGSSLTLRQIAERLADRNAKSPQVTEGAVKKSLHDLSAKLRTFYEQNPARMFRITISSSGWVGPDVEYMFEVTKRQLAAYEYVTKALPEAVKLLIPTRRSRGANPTLSRLGSLSPRPGWLAEAMPQCRKELDMLSPAQLRTIRDTLSRLVLDHIAAVVARHPGNIVATQLPVHTVEMWDEMLAVLDDAYLTYTSLTKKVVTRIVVLPEEEDLSWWESLWQHINTRILRGELVWAIPRASAKRFKSAFDYDLILIQDSLVGLVQLDDEYAKHIVGIHPADLQGLTIQKAVVSAQEFAREGNAPFVACVEEPFKRAFSIEALDTWLRNFAENRPAVRA